MIVFNPQYERQDELPIKEFISVSYQAKNSQILMVEPSIYKKFSSPNQLAVFLAKYIKNIIFIQIVDKHNTPHVYEKVSSNRWLYNKIANVTDIFSGA